MIRIVIARAFHGLVVLLAVVTVLFFLLRASGDPVALMVGPNATPEATEQFRRSLGLDQPLPLQYLRFLAGAARLDFGDSIGAHRDAFAMVMDVLPTTLVLAFGALLVGLCAAIPIGVYSAIHRGNLGSVIAMLASIIGVSLPGFWLGILLILIFSVRLHWLPSFGTAGLLSWIMPIATLSVGLVARQSRLVRAGMLEVWQQDYIRTAFAKGLSSSAVLSRHAVRNALLPVVASLGIDLSFLVGGALVVEQVFAIPGMGRQVFQAINSRDYPLVEATVFAVAVWVVVINFLFDIIYGYIDPRIATEAVA